MAYGIRGGWCGNHDCRFTGWWYIRTYPSEHPSINKAELDHIVAANGAETSSKKYRLADIKPYLKQRNVIALICGWVCYSFVFYGLMTWLPLYFGPPTVLISNRWAEQWR